MNKKGQLDLTSGSIFKVLLLFVLPIMAGSLIQQLYTTVDAIVVGKFAGKEGLAAIDSVSILFKFPINFLSGLSAGTTIVMSSYFGEKNEKELDRAIHTGYTLALFLGILVSVLGFIFAPSLMNIMSVPEDIYQQSLLYCRIYFAGLWTMTLYNMISGMLRAYGDSKSPFYILTVCCVINIVGDLLLVGILHLGVAGAAAATIAAQLVSAVLALWCLSKIHGHCHKAIWSISVDAKDMWKILRLGLPLAFQSILFPIANSMVQANINTMGTNIIASWAVCSKLDLLIWLIADAMSPALSTYVSQNLGAGKSHRVWKGVLYGAAISFGLVAIISAALFIVPDVLGGLFVANTDAAAIIPLVVEYMKMMAPFYVFYTFAESFSGACCGMGDTIKPMLLTLICTCGLRVAAILTIFQKIHTMECIVWIYIASWIVSGIAFIIMFLLKKARYKIRPSQE